MKIKTIITTTITNNSLSSRFFSFEVPVLLFLTVFLPFTTTNETTIFTDIDQEAWAFKPTVPSDQGNQQQYQDQEKEENIQQIGNQTDNTANELIGSSIADLFK